MSGIFGSNVLRVGSQTGIGAIAWKGESDPALKTLQEHMNPILSRLGYNGINPDGVLGSMTCGAIALLGKLQSSVTAAEWATLDAGVMSEASSQCQSYTMPAKKAVSAPPPPAKTTAASTVAPSRGGSSDIMWLGLGAAAAFGVYLMMRKKRR